MDNGGIRILPGDKGEMKASYPLMPIWKKRWRTALAIYPPQP